MSIAEDIDEVDTEVWDIREGLNTAIEDLENIFNERFADVELLLDGIKCSLEELRDKAEKARELLDEIINKYEP